MDSVGEGEGGKMWENYPFFSRPVTNPGNCKSILYEIEFNCE